MPIVRRKARWLLLAVLLGGVSSLPTLSVSVNTTDGSYKVEVDGEVWLESAFTAFYADQKKLSTADNSLVLSAHSIEDSMTNLTWVPAGKTSPRFVTSFIQSSSSTIIFEQFFPDGVQGAKSPGNSASSAFPVFKKETAAAGPVLQAFAGTGQSTTHFSWDSKQHYDPALSPLTERGTGGGNSPLALYTTKDSKLKTIILSPFTNLMAAYQGIAGATLVSGLFHAFNSYPKGYRHQTVLTAGERVTDTMMAWGDLMLAQGGKTRTKIDHPTDKSLTDLGYWVSRVVAA
jgi:hypothetical protein